MSPPTKRKYGQEETPPLGMTLHELFLPEGPDDFLVFPVFISIQRLKPYADSGAPVFNAEDLPNITTIVERFGGGVYQLQARDERKCVLAWRKIGPLRGKPKPMHVGDDAFEEESDTPAPAAAAGASGIDALMTFMAQLQTNQNQFLTTLQNEAKQDRAAQQAREAAAAAAERERSDKQNERMFGILSDALKAKTEVPVQLAKEASEGKDGPLETFMAGVEFAAALKPEAAGESTVDLINAGLEAFGKYKAIQGGALPSPGSNGGTS